MITLNASQSSSLTVPALSTASSCVMSYNSTFPESAKVTFNKDTRALSVSSLGTVPPALYEVTFSCFENTNKINRTLKFSINNQPPAYQSPLLAEIVTYPGREFSYALPALVDPDNFFVDEKLYFSRSDLLKYDNATRNLTLKVPPTELSTNFIVDLVATDKLFTKKYQIKVEIIRLSSRMLTATPSTADSTEALSHESELESVHSGY